MTAAVEARSDHRIYAVRDSLLRMPDSANDRHDDNTALACGWDDVMSFKFVLLWTDVALWLLFATLVTLMSNLVADLAYGWLDPRITLR